VWVVKKMSSCLEFRLKSSKKDLTLNLYDVKIEENILKKMKRVLFYIFLLVFFMIEGVIFAQKKVRKGEVKRRGKVIKLEEMVIEGRIQKPEAFYVLSRASLGFKILELNTSFVKDIPKSVKKEPF
jgi:hypothetical protein